MVWLKFTILFGGAIFGVWLAEYGNTAQWDTWRQIAIACGVAIMTLVAEACVLFVEMKAEVEKYMPASIFSLKKRVRKLEHRIAFTEYENAEKNLACAFNGSDFVCNDLLQANSIILKELKKGQAFRTLSMLNNAELWDCDINLQEYLMLNLAKAVSGVVIERIFVFESETELRKMAHILVRQYQAGIKVYTLLASKAAEKGYTQFLDFSIASHYSVVLYVEREQRLDRIWVTSNRDRVNHFETLFASMVSIAKPFQLSET